MKDKIESIKSLICISFGSIENKDFTDFLDMHGGRALNSSQLVANGYTIYKSREIYLDGYDVYFVVTDYVAIEKQLESYREIIFAEGQPNNDDFILRPGVMKLAKAISKVGVDSTGFYAKTYSKYFMISDDFLIEKTKEEIFSGATLDLTNMKTVFHGRAVDIVDVVDGFTSDADTTIDSASEWDRLIDDACKNFPHYADFCNKHRIGDLYQENMLSAFLLMHLVFEYPSISKTLWTSFPVSHYLDVILGTKSTAASAAIARKFRYRKIVKPMLDSDIESFSALFKDEGLKDFLKHRPNGYDANDILELEHDLRQFASAAKLDYANERSKIIEINKGNALNVTMKLLSRGYRFNELYYYMKEMYRSEGLLLRATVGCLSDISRLSFLDGHAPKKRYPKHLSRVHSEHVRNNVDVTGAIKSFNYSAGNAGKFDDKVPRHIFSAKDANDILEAAKQRASKFLCVVEGVGFYAGKFDIKFPDDTRNFPLFCQETVDAVISDKYSITFYPRRSSKEVNITVVDYRIVEISQRVGAKTKVIEQWAKQVGLMIPSHVYIKYLTV